MEKIDRTKRLLADTLKDMANRMPLKSISVQKLVKECQLNRSTFYYHFKDIQDLINWIYHVEITVPIHDFIRTEENFLSGISRRVLEGIYQDKDFYTQAIQLKGQNNLCDYILQENISNWDCMFEQILKRQDIQIESLSDTVHQELSYTLKYFCYGHYFAAMQWVRRGMPLAPDLFATLLDDAGRKGLFQVMEELLGTKISYE